MMKYTLFSVSVAAISGLSLCLGLAPSVKADPIEEFYRGKQLRMVVGYAPGGGYDLYGRLASEFLSKFIPGNPTIITQNMPGSGSFKAAKWIYAIAPKDGTVLGSVDQALALNSVSTMAKEDIDVTQFRYIGRLTSVVDVGIGRPGAPFHTFEDARTSEIVVGVTSAASSAVLLPSALQAYGGAKFKLVRGYKGAAEILLAVEQGEVQLVGGIAVPILVTRRPDWILERKAPILYQNALKRHPLLPHVATLPELATSAEGKNLLRVIASTGEIGRSVLTTPGIPAERLTALRNAFQKMVNDPEFKAQVERRRVEVNPATGEEIDKLVRETTQLPKTVLDKLAALYK